MSSTLRRSRFLGCRQTIRALNRNARVRPRVLSLESRSVPTVFTVNSTGDGAGGTGTSGTLRYCVGASATGDTITFDTVTFNTQQTITLDAGQLTIPHSLTINGPATAILTLENGASASTTARIFNITGGTVSISNMLITGGTILDANGGGVLISSSTVTLTNVCVEKCSVANTSGTNARYGGGISATSGSLTINGGGLMLNSVTGGSGTSFGGALYSAAATTTLNGTMVQSNTSAYRGGGIFYDNSSGVLTLQLSTDGQSVTTVDQNSAAYSGGGVYVAAGKATLISVEIKANTSTSFTGGGGLYISSTQAVTIDQTTIHKNSSYRGGGGLMLVGATDCTITTARSRRTRPMALRSRAVEAS